ncbi:MAG: hypothetical protein IJ523_02750 [Succinivibrionaceae bacterium]|nr:hypothetical protein [Succinivibrionaceae bacterium]
MKDRIRIESFSLDLRRRIRCGQARISSRGGCYLMDSDGFVSECSPLNGFSAETQEDILSSGADPRFPSASFARSVLSRRLRPAAPETDYVYIGSGEDLDAYLKTHAGANTTETQNPAARSEDMTEELLAAQRKVESPAGAEVSDLLTESLSTPAVRSANSGPSPHQGSKKIFKIKVGRLAGIRELELIDRIDRLFPDAGYILDANMNWTFRQAEDFLGQMPAERILYAEDPLPDPKDCARLADRTGIGIGADELLRRHGVNGIDPLTTTGWVIKPTLAGSLDRCEETAEAAAIQNGYLTVSSAYESPLGLCLLAAWARDLKRKSGIRVLQGLDTCKIFKF